MPCPNCDHTMQMIAEPPAVPAWWCPRCGTIARGLITEHNQSRDIGTPSLVDRCRRFQHGLADEGVSVDCLRDNWIEAGIREAINIPGNRR